MELEPSRRRNTNASKRPSGKGGASSLGAMARQINGRLPSRMMFAQITGGTNAGPGGPPNKWLRALRDELAVFLSIEGSTEESPRQFGAEIVLWVHAAKRASEWYRGVLEAAESFIARRHVEVEKRPPSARPGRVTYKAERGVGEGRGGRETARWC